MADSNNFAGYDLIGDIHGQANELKALLDKLGYQAVNDVYRHPTRQVIFLGDFIDRGEYQKEVISIVRAMVEAKTALAVMGNHEFNAIAYFTPDAQGGYLRKHSKKNTATHRVFLEAYVGHPEEWKDVIDWFKTLPLWLDLDGIRVIHACWDQSYIDQVTESQDGNNLLSDKLLKEASNKNSEWQYRAIETLLKGKEIRLPAGSHFYDKDGTKRHEIRVRWWDDTADTYKKAFMGPDEFVTHIPDDPMEGNHLIEYSHTSTPVFLGHYWLEGPPIPLADNIACLDYSVAKPGGILVAYRWDGEQTLDSSKYVSVKRTDN